MHDIRTIRDNPAAFDQGLALRGLDPLSVELLKLDAAKRDHIQKLQDAQGRRNALSKEIGEAVNRAMEALPEELRTAITLREIEGLSYEEIANVMTCPIGTVRSRIFRARDAIAAELRPLLDTNDERRW